MRKNKGITLLALIITIVILLILLAVSIDLVIDGKIFNSAEKAVNGTNAKVAQEQTRIDELMEEWNRLEQDQCAHIWGEENITKAATCTETGTKTRTCTKCGKVETLTIQALGHNYVSGKCTRCNENEPKETAKPGIRTDKTLEYESNGKIAWIPNGFTISGIESEQSIDGGLVIYDIPEGTTVDWTNPDSVRTQYNQFVWIPVEVNKTTEPKDTETSIASFKRSVWQDNARVANNAQSSTSFPSSSSSWSDYTEPYSKDSSDYDGTGTGKTGISAQITELTKSIYKYGGFYIGRYEAGSETARKSGSSQTAAFVVQQDKYPYNYVTWGKGMGDISEGAVYLSNSLYTGKTGYGVKSMLCTGAAWDSMLDFIKDSSHNVTSSSIWGNYNDSDTFEITRGAYAVYNTSNYTLGSFNNVKSKYSKMKDTAVLLTTGATERNSSKNIYDVAGNCWEWTTESYTSSRRVVRGRFLRRLWFCLSSEIPRQRRRSVQPRVGSGFSSGTLCEAVSLQSIQ